MHHDVDTLEGGWLCVANVVFDELDLRALEQAGDQISTEEQPVENPHVVSGVRQLLTEHGSDVTGAAGHHHC